MTELASTPHSRRRMRLAGPILTAALGAALILPATRAEVAGPPAALDIDHPAGIAFRGDDLMVAATGLGQLRDVSPAGSVSTVFDGFVPGAFDRGVTGVAVDGAGNTYVAATADGAVDVLTATGTRGVYARGLGAPVGIAFAPDGTLYVADAGGRRLLAVGTGQIARTVASLAGTPYGVALGPDGAIYVSLSRTGVIDRVTPAGAVTTYATVPTSSGAVAGAEGIAFDSTGALYAGAGGGDTTNATPLSTGRVVRIPAGGTGTITDVATNLSGPLNLAFAPASAAVLYVAAQAEGAGTTKNHIATVAVSAGGLPLAAPVLRPTPLSAAPARAAVFQAGSGSVEGGVAVDPSPYAAILPRPFASDTGGNAGEPKIVVTNKGTVFVNDITFSNSPCNPQGVGGFPHTILKRSTDGGRTFTDAEPPFLVTQESSPPCSLDPYIYYDRSTGRLFDADLVGPCTYVEYSDDDGLTWTNSPVCGPGALDDHQTIATGPPPSGVTTSGYPNVLYYCYQSVAFAGCLNSLNGGGSWSVTPSFPYINTDSCGATASSGNGEQTGHLVVAADGTVFLPKANCADGPHVAVSKDGGATWTQQLVHAEAVTPDHEAAVAVDGAGTVYYEWVSATTLLPMLSVSHDDGTTWSAPISIAPPGLTEADQPTLIAGAAGKVAAFFYGTTGDCCYGRTDATKTTADLPTGLPASPWSPYAVISLNASSASPTFLSTPMTDPRIPALKGNCGPGRCSNSFDYWDLYIDGGGRLWSSVTNECLTTDCAKVGLAGTSDGVAEGFAAQLVCGPRMDTGGALTPPSWASPGLCGQTAAATPTTTPTSAPAPTALANTSTGATSRWAGLGGALALAALGLVRMRRRKAAGSPR